MPWSPGEFQSKFNHGLSPAQAAHASHQANAILRSGASEGTAIATASKYEKTHHRDAGGSMPQQGGIGGVSPAKQASSPMTNYMVQRYASLPTEKLAEYSAMMGDSPQGNVINHLLMQRRMQPQNVPDPSVQAPQPAAIPPASMGSAAPPVGAKRGGDIPQRDTGGGMGMSASEGSPWWTRREASAGSGPALGFLVGSTPGRGDAIDTTAPAGSHVIPADVVAGLGEGNSIAGAARMDDVIRSGPGGVALPRVTRGRGIPRPPAPFHDARGGPVRHGQEPAENTPVMLSHGEYVVHPADVRRWGKGNQQAGHDAWDKWIVERRKKDIKKLKSLPGPVKS